MSATQTLTPEALLEAAETLNNDDLDQFVDRVLTLRARRRTPCLPKRESELLLKINEGLPEETWRQYHELVAKRKAETLTPEEHMVLIALTNQMEMAHAQRIGYISELAQLRSKTLAEMMDELGSKPPGFE